MIINEDGTVVDIGKPLSNNHRYKHDLQHVKFICQYADADIYITLPNYEDRDNRNKYIFHTSNHGMWRYYFDTLELAKNRYDQLPRS